MVTEKQHLEMVKYMKEKWKNNVKEGEGKSTLANGDVYEGQ
jgi:coproporphyrinogen III oxidase